MRRQSNSLTIPFFGWLSDLAGRRTLYFLGVFFTIGFAYPLFWLFDTRDPATVTLAVVVALNFGHGTMFGLQSAFFPELFNTRVRYTGASLGFQVSAAIGGGLAPSFILLRLPGKNLFVPRRGQAVTLVL